MKTNNRTLSVYYTAGYPTLDSTVPIAEALEKAGVDFLEIGFPYSDPVADGPVIQHSSTQALKNGMTLKTLFEQLKKLRDTVSIPVYLMGYFNPVLQYGVDAFCKACQQSGVQGVIIPDLPIHEYETLYKDTFATYGIKPVFLITPQTEESRIRKIDELSSAFIYVLSSPSVTGKKLSLNQETLDYFQRIQQMQLKNPIVIGFGISNRESFEMATDSADGAIIGSAFVKQLEEQGIKNTDWITNFVKNIRP